jgi:NAD-dependent DNA ligase
MQIENLLKVSSDLKKDPTANALICELQMIANNAVITALEIIKQNEPERFKEFTGWDEFLQQEFNIDENEFKTLCEGELPDWEAFTKPVTKPAASTNSTSNCTNSSGSSANTSSALHLVPGDEIVITGILSATRADVEACLARHGFNTASRITSSTDLLIVGSKPGATKVNAATNHRVPTADETSVLRAIGITNWYQ